MKDNVPILTQCQEKNAPWKQEEPVPVQIDCTVCYCMSKSMPIEVKDYNENTNLIEEFENDGYTLGIPTLLKELEKLCKEKLRSLKDEESLKTSFFLSQVKTIKKEEKYYKRILSAAQDWIENDLDVCKDY